MDRRQKQLKILQRNPTAMARYQATGRLPSVYRPDSPLIRLLERIPPRDRIRIKHIRLDERLGYRAPGLLFPDAEALLRWLKPDEWVSPGEGAAASSRQMAHFNRPLVLEELLQHAGSHPGGLSTLDSAHACDPDYQPSIDPGPTR